MAVIKFYVARYHTLYNRNIYYFDWKKQFYLCKIKVEILSVFQHGILGHHSYFKSNCRFYVLLCDRICYLVVRFWNDFDFEILKMT